MTPDPRIVTIIIDEEPTQGPDDEDEAFISEKLPDEFISNLLGNITIFMTGLLC